MVAEKIALTERLLWILNTLFHQTYAVVTAFIMWTIFYNFPSDSYFTWHMALSTLAYVPLMGEAIVLFAHDNVWSRSLDRTTKSWIHGIFLFISAILVTVGISLLIDHNHGKHFQSTHGWTGLVSWIFILLSQFLGIAAAKSQIFSAFLKPIVVKFLHNFLGILGFVFGIVSLCYGIKYWAFDTPTSPEARTTTFYLLGITTFWSVLAALKSMYNQLKTIVF